MPIINRRPVSATLELPPPGMCSSIRSTTGGGVGKLSFSKDSVRIVTLVKLIMLGVAGLVIQRGLRRPVIIVSATADRSTNLLGSFSTCAKSSNDSAAASGNGTRHRRLQVQIVHRHGDRTPITPLLDEAFWEKQMVSATTLEQIQANTQLIEPQDTSEKRHNANGRGPFGKLTELGLRQMVDVGAKLRCMLSGSNEPVVDDKGRTLYPHIWETDRRPLQPSNIRVISTNFLRTIQSVQGVLLGLFPLSTKEKISIDIRNTNWMIPDPQPRHTEEQAVLEVELSVRPHILAREQELLPLAVRATQALQESLAPDAREADFGVPQKKAEGAHGIQPLSWNQLAEITKCLSVRKMLPSGIAPADQATISEYAAWRWFESFRNPRLAHLAMGRMGNAMVKNFVNHEAEPPMTIWSAHDSTLIGLMCLFRLEQPAEWPEYGSYLMLELIQVNEGDVFVRFSLNGKMLRSQWEDGAEPTELIALATLTEKLQAQETGVKVS